MAEHKDITDPNIHETKGAAAATVGQVLIATGSGTATFQTPPFSTMQIGWWDYNDLETQTTPISLAVVGTKYDLTNDTLGPNTQTGFGLSGVSKVWDPVSDRFDFTEVDIGDTFELRSDLTITTTNANTAVSLELEFGVGTGTPFVVPVFAGTNFKTAGTYQLVHSREWYIGSAFTRDNPCRLRMSADTAGATVKVNGWFVRVIKPSA